MTREDIIRMAREARSQHEGFLYVTDEFALRFAALVAAAEREACAKVCEEVLWPDSGRWAVDFAAAIRSRGEVKP